MNEDDIDDLKQFITATVTQQIVGLRQDFNRLESKVDALEFKVDVIDQKVDNLSVAVADALDTSNETAEERFKDHERRITQLEHKAAI